LEGLRVAPSLLCGSLPPSYRFLVSWFTPDADQEA
jgi:hypothetical protein